MWQFADLDWRADAPMPDIVVSRDDITEIMFTSGATGEPKGVVIRHRNVMANIVPVEREVISYRKLRPPVSPDPLPESPAAQPHVWAGDGNQCSADG